MSILALVLASTLGVGGMEDQWPSDVPRDIVLVDIPTDELGEEPTIYHTAAKPIERVPSSAPSRSTSTPMPLPAVRFLGELPGPNVRMIELVDPETGVRFMVPTPMGQASRVRTANGVYELRYRDGAVRMSIGPDGVLSVGYDFGS